MAPAADAVDPAVDVAAAAAASVVDSEATSAVDAAAVTMLLLLALPSTPATSLPSPASAANKELPTSSLNEAPYVFVPLVNSPRLGVDGEL